MYSVIKTYKVLVYAERPEASEGQKKKKIQHWHKVLENQGWLTPGRTESKGRKNILFLESLIGECCIVSLEFYHLLISGLTF